MTDHVTFNEKKLRKYQNSQLTLFVDPHGIYIFAVFELEIVVQATYSQILSWNAESWWECP